MSIQLCLSDQKIQFALLSSYLKKINQHNEALLLITTETPQVKNEKWKSV